MENIPGDYKQRENIRLLLLEMMAPIRRAYETPLQVEIDSHSIAVWAWEKFPNEPPKLELLQILNALEEEIASSLSIEREKLVRHQSSDTALANSIVTGLAKWFDKFFHKVRCIDPQALEITGLLVEGYEERDVSEKLETGLRLVKRIVKDIRDMLTEDTCKQ